MLFIGPHTSQKLNAMGIFTLGDLAMADTDLLRKRFGIVGERLKNCALGLDCEEVRRADVHREIKSVGHGTTALRDMTCYKDAETVLCVLSEMVATRLRRYGMYGSVVHVDIRRNDLTHEAKQKTVPKTFVAKEITTQERNCCTAFGVEVPTSPFVRCPSTCLPFPTCRRGCKWHCGRKRTKNSNSWNFRWTKYAKNRV